MALSWFDYLLNPKLLVQQLDEGIITETDAGSLIKELLVNLLNSQNQAFFSDTPFELWFCESQERKVPVIRSLCLQLAASMDWRLGTLEKALPPPLMLYVLQTYIQMQPLTEGVELHKVTNHPELNADDLMNPGPVIHSLILFHRWLIRYYMQCRTPQRVERTSNVMVPGVKKEPALIYRDQTSNFVMSMFPSSVRFLNQVLEGRHAPSEIPSPKSFVNIVHQFSTDVWTDLKECKKEIVLSLIAYDLGSFFFFNEEYGRSTECFNLYFQYSANRTSLLTSDINEGKLKGYLMCLGLAVSSTPDKPSNIRFLESMNKLDDNQSAADNMLSTLEADTLYYNISQVEIESAQIELQRKYGMVAATGADSSKRRLITGLEIYTLVRKILKGLPLTGKNIEDLQKVGDDGLAMLQKQITKIQAQGTSRDKTLIKNLVVKLVLFNIIPPDHRIVSIYKGDISVAALSIEPVNLKLNTTLAETFNLKKICKYNAAVQLLSSFQVPMLTSLAANLGGSAGQVTHKWSMQEQYSGKIIHKNMNINHFDDIVIILCKVNQLKKMKNWDEATNLLVHLSSNLLSQEKNLTNLNQMVQADKLSIDILKENEKLEESEDISNYPDIQILRQAQTILPRSDNNINLLQELCLNVVLHDGDWDTVSTYKLPNTTLANFVKALNSLMLNLQNNSNHLTKKFAREVWETMVPYVSSAANKRKESNQPAPVKDRNEMQKFLEHVSNLDLALLVLSLLSALFNVAKDDPSTELITTYAGIWPTGLAANTSIQAGLVETFLQPILQAYIKKFPKEANIILTYGDLNFAKGNYRSALALYVETVALRTDYFEHPIEQIILPDAYVNRMIRCCTEMGKLIQAVVLSQFCVDPNYAQIFKYVEDRDTCDGADSLYSCIWDMSILEFAMSLHTRRGEVARRRHVLSCIMQLELNTNNELEIKRAAASIRKSVFFRSLSAQLFAAPA